MHSTLENTHIFESKYVFFDCACGHTAHLRVEAQNIYSAFDERSQNVDFTNDFAYVFQNVILKTKGTLNLRS